MKAILFNTEMVRAILDGRKTQTRIVVKTDGEYFTDSYNYHIRQACFMLNGKSTYINYPFDVGDILYVRETFVIGVLDGTMPESDTNPITIFYKADNSIHGWMDENEDECNIPWKPSIHMPKEYARIFLKVTNVKVERLQDISDEDCLAEGIYEVDDNDCTGNYKVYTIGKPNIQDGIILSDKYNSAYEAFEILWDSVAKDGYKIKDNPYVFRNEFERVEKPTFPLYAIITHKEVKLW